MTVESEFVLHTEPVRRDRSNFIINAELPEKGPAAEVRAALRQAGRRRPFRGVLHPVLHLLHRPWRRGRHLAEGRPQVRPDWGGRTVVSPAGRGCCRVEGRGALIEWSSRDLLAVDAVDKEHAQQVADFLAEREKAGQLVYETGRS